MALKRKKQYENQIEKISGARITIEAQVMAIENANVNLETIKAMEKGAEAMKAIHGTMYATLLYFLFLNYSLRKNYLFNFYLFV